MNRFMTIAIASWMVLYVTAAVSASPVIAEAQSLVNQSKPDAALRKLDEFLANAPQDAEARFLRGTILAQLGRDEDALKAFSDLIQEFPQLPEPYNNAAVIYAQRGEYESARATLAVVLQKHPGYATAHENMADVYAALAAVEYRRAEDLDGANEDVPRKIEVLNQLAGGPAAGCPPCAAADDASAQAGGKVSAGHPAVAVVKAWAAAWSARDVDGYLAAYAPGFKPEDGKSKDEWAAQRRERIEQATQISVRVVEPSTTPMPGGVQVQFRQRYKSDRHSDAVNKVLELREDNGAWKIMREYTR